MARASKHERAIEAEVARLDRDLALAQEERDRITETIIALQNQRSILDRVKDSAGQMKDDDGLPHQLEETKQWCALGERVGVCMELEGLLRVEKRRKVMREAQARYRNTVHGKLAEDSYRSRPGFKPEAARRQRAYLQTDKGRELHRLCKRRLRRRRRDEYRENQERQVDSGTVDMRP